MLARHGATVAADSAFRSANVALPVEARCEWNDLRVLLEAEARRQYNRYSCAQRDSLNTHLWWLADPLFIEPGNERRVEHYSRKVVGMLRSALERDERFGWSDRLGGDARREMVLRYGWPSYVFWAGGAEDSNHTGYTSRWRIPFDPPYTSFEYTRPRQHLVPVWSAVADPFASKGSDWVINEPPPPPRPNLPESMIRPWLWWPPEHFAAAVPLAQLPDGQVALFRRENSALLAVAVQIDRNAVGLRSGEPLHNATLVASVAPDSVSRLAVGSHTDAGPMILSALLDSRPTVAGIEVPPPAPGRSGARSRFGVRPPPPLVAMRTGEFAISDPVLLYPPLAGEQIPSRPDSAIKRMMGSTRLQNATQLGVYWESYGFEASDTVEIAVWIERYTRDGIARRFAARLNLATDRTTPVANSWQEAGAALHANVTPGTVTTISRAVTLDVSKLPKGDYWLDVVVRKVGQTAVRGRRSLVIE